MPTTRLLLIEDDFDVAEMLLMYFRTKDYEVLHADTGAEGIELARTRFPNLILLDVMLPDMDGYEICVRLRGQALTKYIPTLFLTQKDERSAKVKGLQLGADDYITKPFDIEELRLRVEGSIRRATRENLYEQRTGLPTGLMIDEELARAEQDGDAHVLRMALSGFQAFTEVYSFMAATDVLFHTGKAIRDVLSEQGDPRAFVGYDVEQFVVVCHSNKPAVLEALIFEQCNAQLRSFYTFGDADRGGILLGEGTSQERFVPMMQLTRASEAINS